MLDTYRISDLEQVRLLSDPLKLKIIQALAEAPGTTRDVAEQLGENLTRLYRHVDALLEAGLIEVTQEQKKRGTVERTFRAVAQRFEVDQALFADDGGNEAVRELFRSGEAELLAALAARESVVEPLCMRLKIKASPPDLQRLRDLLEEWLESAQEVEECSDLEEAGALIAFYPLGKSE